MTDVSSGETVERMYAQVNNSDPRVLLITGGSGTGKTYNIMSFVKDSRSLNLSGAYLSPTGILCSRFAEYGFANLECSNLHSFFSIDPQSPQVQLMERHGYPDVIFIDEVSMIEESLWGIIWKNVMFYRLTKFCAVIGIGDPHQLQPVRGRSIMNKISFFRSSCHLHFTRTYRFTGENAVFYGLLGRLRKGDLRNTSSELRAFCKGQVISNGQKVFPFLRKIIPGMDMKNCPTFLTFTRKAAERINRFLRSSSVSYIRVTMEEIVLYFLLKSV